MGFKKTEKKEIAWVIEKGIFRLGKSPLRAQVLVASSHHHKKMAIDNSLTASKYALLDAYSLLRIDDMMNEIDKFKIFPTLDLPSPCHLVVIKEENFHAAFEHGKIGQV